MFNKFLLLLLLLPSIAFSDGEFGTIPLSLPIAPSESVCRNVGDTAFESCSIPPVAPVDSVNGQTGVVVLDTDDLLEGVNKYVTASDVTNLGNLSGTNTGDQVIPVTGVDFDPVGTDNSDNNAINTLYSGLVTNANHTGEVTGSTVLTLDDTAISNKSLKGVLSGTEEVVINDAGTLKKTTAQDIADLGGGGDVSAATNITDNSIVRGDGGAKGVQDSGIIIDDSNNMTAIADMEAERGKFRVAVSGSQDSLLKVLDTGTGSGGDNTWRGRALFGAENSTLLMGVYNGKPSLGAHTWTSADAATGAAWEDLYLSPSGTKKTYIGSSGFDPLTTILTVDNNTNSVGVNKSSPVVALDVVGVGAFTADVTVADEVYGVGWNASLEVPTKNALYDKIETIAGGGGAAFTDITTGTNATATMTVGTGASMGTSGTGVITANNAEQTWVPTIGAVLPMTWVTSTITSAKYWTVGSMVCLELNATGTTGGTASAYIDFQIPFSASNAVLSGFRENAFLSGEEAIFGRTFGVNYIRMKAHDGSNWSLGSNRAIHISGCVAKN